MNLYEHTIIARQDASPSEIKQLTEKYTKIIEKNDGEIIQTENWGILNLSYLIKKNKKGSYIHFKFKSNGKVIKELEKTDYSILSISEGNFQEFYINKDIKGYGDFFTNKYLNEN